MTTENTQFTVGKTTFYQGENGTHPLFRIEPGIPCRYAREQSSELMGYVRELTITGLMDEKPMMIWAAHYLGAMAKALKMLRRAPVSQNPNLKTCALKKRRAKALPFLNSPQPQPMVIKLALPPAAAVFTLTARSITNRSSAIW